MKILDCDSNAAPVPIGDAIEIQSDGGDALFRLRLIGTALDVATPPNNGQGPSGQEFGLGLMILSPVSSNRVIIRRERRERPRP